MLANDADMQGYPVGLVDDLPHKQGTRIHGVKVLGTLDAIPAICAGGRVDQIVVAIPSSTKEERDRIFALCAQTGLRTLTLPLIHDLPQGLAGKLQLREVEIADLLSRKENVLDIAQMGYVTGRRVLVTGGGGSIGSELVRQLLPAGPAQIVLFDIYENTTYELYHEIAGPAAEQGTDIQTYIGSITHLPAIEDCFDRYQPQVVFHAAAHKHVPLMETNAREAVENNVFGTLNVVRLAHERGCSHFVLISTDKAVNPSNVMGATKRMCEMIVQHYSTRSQTVFTAVRFGNVLGSHGSVIPLFKRQLPLRIIKMRPDFPVKMRGAFALPANEERTGFAAFSQVKSLCSNGLRNLQADFQYFTAASAQTRQFFAKPIFEGDFAAKAVA